MVNDNDKKHIEKSSYDMLRLGDRQKQSKSELVRRFQINDKDTHEYLEQNLTLYSQLYNRYKYVEARDRRQHRSLSLR